MPPQAPPDTPPTPSPARASTADGDNLAHLLAPLKTPSPAARESAVSMASGTGIIDDAHEVAADDDVNLLRLMIEQAPDPIYVVAVDAEILYRNSAATGPQPGLEPRHLFDCVDPRDIPALRSAFQRCLQSAQPVTFEADSPAIPAAEVTSPGRCWSTAKLVPVFAGNQLQCLLAYGRRAASPPRQPDHSDHASQLRASQQRLAMVVQATPLAAVIVDSNLCVNEWNPAAERLFGYSRHEALGKPLIDLIIPAQHRESVHERFVGAFSGRYGFSRSRNINITREGKLVTCNWFNTPLYDEHGQIEAMAALGQDISQQLRAEEALTAAMRAAEASARAKSQFLANMSHEIRTPMHGVLGASELLMRQPLDDEIRSDVELIHRSATALLSVVDDILDFSKLEADTVRLHKSPVDISDLLHDTVELLRPMAEDKQLRYTFSQHGEGSCVALIDPVRFRQIINNLVGNAIKFTEHGFVQVEHRWSQRGAYIHFQIIVRDSGPGIEPGQLTAIFEDFYQADSSWTRSYGGTGLGLAISRRLAALMDGTIDVQSEPGQGSRFSLNLCAATAQPFTPVAHPASEQQFHGTVLLVDDNPVNLAVGEKQLRQIGLTVDTARDGHQVLALAGRRRYDLIFMDIQMPDLDGLATCRQLRANGCAVPIIAVTADALPEDRERCLAADMQAILTKPFRAADIALAVRPYLQAGPQS